ncbi:MAG: cytochrome c-type biogenesis protein [Acidimicrobiales bacterium]
MKLHRLLAWAGVVVVALGSLAVGTRDDGQAPSPTSRAEHIAAELRCPVCQGLSVLDSDSSTARSIRQDITRRIDAGQTDGEIRQAYVDRYGEWILLRPRGRGFGTIVWLLPAAATAAGLGALGYALVRWRRRLAATASTEDRLLVTQALQRAGDGQR